MRSYRPPTVAACQSKGQETSCNSNACLEVQSQWCAAASNAANILVKISQEAHRVQTGLVARGCTLCLNVADHPSPPGELLKGCPKFFRRLPLLAGFNSSVSDLHAGSIWNGYVDARSYVIKQGNPAGVSGVWSRQGEYLFSKVRSNFDFATSDSHARCTDTVAGRSA